MERSRRVEAKEERGVTRTLNTLLVQLAPVTHDVEANLATACALLERHPHADLAVFSELFLQSYALRGIDPIHLGQDDLLAPLAGAARRHHVAIVLGTAELSDAGMHNTAVCIDERGAIVASYRKVHLFGAEPRFFVPGDEYVVVPLGGVEVGVLLCYDLEFPEAARALASGGAQLLVTSSANMDPYAEDHALFVKVRALENGLPHVYVNCVGEEGRLRFCGRSSVVDSRGRLLVELPPQRPEVRLVEVPVDQPRDAEAPDYLADRRPEVRVRALGGPPDLRPARR